MELKTINKLPLLLSLCVSVLCGLAGAAPECGFQDKVSGPGFNNALWGLSVRDAATGKELVACNSTKNMVPASIQKLFVTGAALDLLGPGTRFKTRVYMAGPVVKGVLNGAVYIRGGGDPSFGAEYIKGAPSAETEFEKWTQALRTAGVTAINGPVIADDSLFQGPSLPGSWAWEDIGNYYAAQPTAMLINDNLYKLYFRPGVEAGDPAEVLRTDPAIPGLTFTNLMLTGREGSGDNGYVFGFPEQYSAILRGTVPKGPPEFSIKGSIPDPALFAAQEFSGYLNAHGVKVSGAPLKINTPVDYGAAAFLAETEGAPVRDIVFVTNKRSVNLYTEVLLRQLALVKGYEGTASNGVKVLKDHLAANGVDTSELRLSDASGLSRLNLAHASEFTAFLSALSTKDFFGVYMASLVYPDDPDATGHIRKMGAKTELEKFLKIKSGSLTGVRGYAGYLATKKGRLLSFTSILNNYTASGPEIDRMHEALLLELFKKY